MSSMEMAPLLTASSKIFVSAAPASIARVTNSVFSSRIDHNLSSISSLSAASGLSNRACAPAFECSPMRILQAPMLSSATWRLSFSGSRTPSGLSWEHHETGILAFGHEIMVNSCLIRRQWALPAYQKSRQIFDFGRLSAYNAALSIPPSRTNPKKRPHGRTFPVQEHHAPQRPAGCPEIQAVQQAGAGNHRGGQNGPARSLDECPAARRDHFRAPGEHVEGLDRARGEEGDRLRGRELRRDPLRGLWPGRRRRDRRGPDR